jgi:hypothetical protein
MKRNDSSAPGAASLLGSSDESESESVTPPALNVNIVSVLRLHLHPASVSRTTVSVTRLVTYLYVS